MKRSTIIKGRKFLRIISAVLVVAFVCGITAPLGIFDSGIKVGAGYWGPEVGTGLGVPLFNKQSKDDTDIFWINNLAKQMELSGQSGQVSLDITNLSTSETSLYGSRIDGLGSDWSITFDGPQVDTSTTPDLVFCIYGSLGNSSGWMMAGDGLNATIFNDKGYATQRTDWLPYVQTTAVISGSGGSDLRNLAFVIADLVSPGETRDIIYSIGEDPEGPVLWLDFGETLRAANSNITWEGLADAMRLKLGIVPADKPDDEILYVTAAATRHDGAKLGFQIIAEDWEQLAGGEFRIVSVDNISPEGESYALYEFINRYNDTTPRYVETPMTDIAGNPVVLPSAQNVRIKNLIVDGVSPVVARVDLNGSAAKELETDPDGWAVDIDRRELFSTVGDTIEVKIEMNELLAGVSASDMSAITLEWNLQKDGAPVMTKLVSIDQKYASTFDKPISALVFETLTITADMVPEGEQIVPVKIHGTAVLSDIYGNAMGASVDLSDIKPNRQTYLDITPPVMELDTKSVLLGQETDGSKLLTVEFRISDGDGLTSSVMGEEGKLSLSTYGGAPIIKFNYEITRSATPPATLTKTGTLAGGSNAYLMFPMTGEGSYYIHLSLLDVSSLELDDEKGLVIGGVFCDAAGNTSNENDLRYTIGGLSIDHISPKLSLIGKGVTISQNVVDNTQNDAVFKVFYDTSDLNLLDRVEYQWTASDATPEDNGWTIISNTEGAKSMSGTLEETITGTENVSLTLHVRSYDKYGNMKQDQITLDAELLKVVGHQEYTSDPTTPDAKSDIIVHKPVSTDPDITSGSYYTKATVTFTDYEGKQNNYTWVRVFDFEGYESAPLLSLTDPDGSAAEWYCVKIGSSGNYISIYTGDELTGEKAVPIEHYGEVKADFISSAKKESLVPATANSGSAGDPASDTTLHEDGSFTFLHTAARDDAHDIKFGTIKDSEGVDLTLGSYGGDKYYLFNKTMAGVEIPFTILNDIRSEWGYADVDFENSYAVLLRATEKGDFAAVTDEASARIPLAAATEQIFTVPSLDKNGKPFASGAYVLQIHLAQKAGGAQDFFMAEDGMVSVYNVFLLLDASSLPTLFGVTDYTIQSQVVESSLTERIGLPITKTAPEGEVISYVNVGVAKPSQMYGDRVGVNEDSSNVVYIDGHPAYVLEVTNALQNNMMYDGGNLSLDLTAKPSETGAWLGYEMGVVAGIKYWNAASAGDPSTLAYVTKTIQKREVNGETVYILAFYESLDWYTVDKETGEKNETIVSTKEELAAKSIEDFALIVGSNTICYQLIMKNGEESPVYQFELNLFDEAPEVEFDFELVDSNVLMEDTSGVPVFREYASEINVKVVDAYSPYGEVKFYRADYIDYAWVYTPYDAQTGIPLTKNGDGYAGISSTAKDSYSDRVMDQFILAVDSVGNAVCLYPILDGSYAIEGNRTYYGIGTANDATLELIPTWSESENKFTNETNRILFNRYQSEKLYRTVDYMTVQIDDREPCRVVPHDNYEDAEDSGRWATSEIDYKLVPNSAGIWEFKSDLEYYVESLRFDLPYDPSIPEGQMIEHTITIVTYGYQDETGARSEQTHQFTLKSPNVKPTAELIELTGQELAERGFHSFNTSQAMQMIYPPQSNDAYMTYHDFSVHGNDVYTVLMRDKYGEEYTFEFTIDDYPADPKIEYSTVDPTTGPVTVTVTSDNYLLYVDTESFASMYGPNGTVSGNNSKCLTLTYRKNGSAAVKLYTGDADFETSALKSSIDVTNIVDGTMQPTLQWSYTGEAMAQGDVVYYEIGVSLVDAGGKDLIDPVTGKTPEYTFYFGANKGDTYVFSGYTDQYGITGPDITATLPFNLRRGPVFDNEGAEIVPVKDTFNPDVAVTGHTIRNGVSSETRAAFKLINDRTGANIFVGLPGYESENRYGAANVYNSMGAFITRMGWGDTYSFRIDVADESEVKLFVKTVGADAPDFANGKSDSINGVTLQGRTVVVSENTEFVLYAVDSENNVSAVSFVIENLGPAPVPSVIQVLMKDNTARLYLRVDLDGVTDLVIKNTGAVKEEDTNSTFYGEYYLTQSTNTDVTLYYSYSYDGSLYEGSVDVQVSGIDTTPFDVKNAQGIWSLNYDGDGKRYTNREISGQFEFTKMILDVEVMNVAEIPDGVSVSWLDNRLTVIYEKNAEALRLKVTALDGKTYYELELPAISNIDTTVPDYIIGEVTYTNASKAEFTITADEAVLVQELNGIYKEIRNLEADVPHTVTVKENGTLVFRLTDKAGNTALASVEINKIVDEPLTVTLKKGDNIVIPETDEIVVNDVITVSVNRTAKIYFNGVLMGTATADAPVNITVSEDAAGFYPAIRAVDEYGKAVLLQFLRIPMGDKLAPVVLCTRNVITVCLGHGR